MNKIYHLGIKKNPTNYPIKRFFVVFCFTLILYNNIGDLFAMSKMIYKKPPLPFCRIKWFAINYCSKLEVILDQFY